MSNKPIGVRPSFLNCDIQLRKTYERDLYNPETMSACLANLVADRVGIEFTPETLQHVTPAEHSKFIGVTMVNFQNELEEVLIKYSGILHNGITEMRARKSK